MDAYDFSAQNSLLRSKLSLILEIFSLLFCLGNCSISRCGTAISGSEMVSWSLEIAVFPVKFPVSREFAWRLVRIPLRRQPRIPAFCQASQETADWAGNPGFSRIRFGLWTAALGKLRGKSPKVSGRFRKYSRFGETIAGDEFDQDCRPRAAVVFGQLIRF
jgi:hypothetical protein